MKLQITLLIIFLTSIQAFSQTGKVGINTESPKSSLDVNGKTDASGNSLSTDTTGLQAPRITRLELTNKGDALYGNDQKGALIYITDISGGNANSQRINITSAGYYYFDGSAWIKIGSGGASTNVTSDNGLTKTGDNIQLGGTLLKNTDIATAGYNTTFSGTGKVGIGNTSPTQKLDVNGTIRANDKLMVGTTWTGGGALSVKNNVATDNIATLVNSENIFKAVLKDDGSLGVNTSSPTEKLDVNGSARLRQIETSTSTGDITLVTDANGVIKKRLQDITGSFRSYLFEDRVLGTNNSEIYRLDRHTQVNDPGNNFDHTTGYFVPTITGLYKAIMTLTLKRDDANYTSANSVVGLATNGQWVMRFSIEKDNIATTNVGSAFTFTGVAFLTANTSYYFGVTGAVTAISNPTGGSGQGLGSFFEIELIK